jgi:hypothetical protein
MFQADPGSKEAKQVCPVDRCEQFDEQAQLEILQISG